MKNFIKIIIVIFCLVLVFGGVIIALRKTNDAKYGDGDLNTPKYLTDVTNVSYYPTKIAGVSVTYVDEGTMQGFHLVPDQKKYEGIVVCYGGSEGSPNFGEAERLAKEGYETLAVFMYGMNNQQKTLARIPLEQFEDVLNYIQKQKVEKGPITVLAGSKGAEYALNLASKYDDISNLVLTAPSAYNFAGLDFKDYGSSWTWQDKELPYIDIKKSSFVALVKNMLWPMLTKGPIVYKETYDTAIKSDKSLVKKVIPVKDVKAHIMIIAGEDDQMWNSPAMAKKIKEQKPDTEINLYKDAGHLFLGNGVLSAPEMRMRTGGSLSANEKANTESQKSINNFLLEKHGK